MKTKDFVETGLSVLGDSRSEALSEAALLFAWKKLSEGDSEAGYPPLSNVIEGKQSLAEVYQQIGEKLEWEDSAYLYSKLPERFPTAGLADIVNELSSLSDFNSKTVIKQLYREFSDDRKARFVLLLPEQLILLMVKLSLLEGKPVYVPFMTSLQLAVEASLQGSPVIFVSKESSPLIEALVLLADIKIFNGNPESIRVLNNNFPFFERVMMVPPFGRGTKSKATTVGSFNAGEINTIKHELDKCDGRLVVLVTQGVLFRGAEELDFRIRLINAGQLEAIVQLPSVLLHTHITTTLMVIDKRRDPNSPTIFYDADQASLVKGGGRGAPLILKSWEDIADFVLEAKNTNKLGFGHSRYAAFIDKEEIKSNGYDLSVRRYVLGDASKGMQKLGRTIPLENVAELIRGQLLKRDSPPQGELFYEVGVKDIGGNGIVLQPAKKVQLSGRMQNRAEMQRLRPGDILLTTKGSVGKVGLIGEDCGDNWVASQSFQIIRLGSASQIRPEYLYHFLSSPLVQSYLAEQATGAVISVLKTADIKALPIPEASVRKQEEVTATHKKIMDKYREIDMIEVDVEILRHKHWRVPNQE